MNNWNINVPNHGETVQSRINFQIFILYGFWIQATISKINGNASTLVDNKPEIRDWKDLKYLLELTFRNQRKIDCYILSQTWKSNYLMWLKKKMCVLKGKVISFKICLLQILVMFRNYQQLIKVTQMSYHSQLFKQFQYFHFSEFQQFPYRHQFLYLQFRQCQILRQQSITYA